MRAGLRGFTLLEMLVGLALIGLMSLALFSALRFGTHSWERSESKSIQVVDLVLVEHTLQRELGKAFPLRVGLASENKVAFEGDTSQVRFFSELPAHFSAGGLSRVEIRYESARSGEASAQGGSLVLRHALQDGLETQIASTDEAGSSVLLKGLEYFRLAYFGLDGISAEAGWKDSWGQYGFLPRLVKVQLKFLDSPRQVEFLIPIRLGEEAGCYQASFQRACGPRR